MANEFKIKNGLSIGGNTSGTTILKSALAASGTLTLPAATDTLVGLATTDTLTNKTLSSVTLTGTVTAGGGVGTSGQVLSSTGTGVQWVNAGNGDVTQTGTQTLSNKTLDYTCVVDGNCIQGNKIPLSSIPSGYDAGNSTGTLSTL